MRVFFYSYRIIAGAAVFAEYKTIPKTIEHLQTFRKEWQNFFPGEIEIERVRNFRSGGFQYDVKRNGKWVDWWDGLHGEYKHETKGPWPC